MSDNNRNERRAGVGDVPPRPNGQPFRPVQQGAPSAQENILKLTRVTTPTWDAPAPKSLPEKTMKDLTKAEQNALIESLTISNAEKIQRLADQDIELGHLGDEAERLQRACDHKDRQTANVSRVFVTLYEEKRTMDLRFGWLEEAAKDVVNSCSDHLPGLIVKLADEIGIEVTENHGNT